MYRFYQNFILPTLKSYFKEMGVGGEKHSQFLPLSALIIIISLAKVLLITFDVDNLGTLMFFKG